MSDRFELAVLGGGVMGAATALAAARRGRRTVLLERFATGHAHGSSHGDGRIIRFTYAEPVYLEMARRAYLAWAEIERRSSQKLTLTTGSWECGPDDSPALAELEATLTAAGIDHERWSAAESARRMPHFRLPATSAAVYQKDGGVVRADRAVSALWSLAAAAGAVTRQAWRCEDIELGSRIVLRGEAGTLSADRLVVTAGGWASELLTELGHDVPLSVTQEQVSHFPPRAGSPLDHRSSAMPTVIDYHDPERPFYALPQIDVPGVKVGWHHGGRRLAIEELEPGRRLAWDEDHAETVRKYVGQRFTALEPQPCARQSCLYTSTPDHHFVLDVLRGEPRVTVGTGFSGHGFKFAPVVGEILAALALDEAPPVELERFRLDRFTDHIPDRTPERRRLA